ncbi:MAG: ADOP family duplicated permease [Gemmatimonadales bacterium]
MRDDPWWRRYWRSFRYGPEVADELQFHIDLIARDLVAQGMSPEAAATEAARRFGDRQRVQADLEGIERRRRRRLRLGVWAAECWADIRFGLRGLRKRPGFTLAAALSLGLGIGASTVVLTVVDTWLLRRMPVERSDELVVIGASITALGPMAVPAIPVPAHHELAERSDLFQSLGAWRIRSAGLEGADGKTDVAYVLSTSANYFDVIGVRAELGRTYAATDGTERHRVLVLTDRGWRRRFGGDSAAIGRSVRINGVPFTILGVTPAWFATTEPILEVDALFPLDVEPDLGMSPAGYDHEWANVGFSLIARRQPDRSVGAIQAALDVLSARMVGAHPGLAGGFRMLVYPESRARPSISSAGLFPVAAGVLIVLSLLVLATAAANVANLILARVSARSSELSVRFALGASRRRVIQQLLTESGLLGLLGLALALGFAAVAVRWLAGLVVMSAVPIRIDFALDTRILAMAAGVAIGAGLLAGIGPAVLASRDRLHDDLRRSGRAGLGGQGRFFRSALVVSQVAVALVVLAAAGLVVRSARNAATVKTGFDPHDVMTATVELEHSQYTAETGAAVLERVVQTVRALPGVTAADWIDGLPLNGTGGAFRDVWTGSDNGLTNQAGARSVATSTVGADYFRTVGMRLLEGRQFGPGDTAGGRRVALINRQAAEALWPGRPAVGQVFRLAADGPPIDVVGVVNDTKVWLISEAPRSVIYLPWFQEPQRYAMLAARWSSRDPAAAGRLREAFAVADPSLAPHGFLWYDDVLRDAPNGLGPLRLGATFGTAIGMLALVLAVVGLYGVMTLSVTQETREIGVRMALGAEPGTIVAGVLRRGLRLVALGVVIGLALALAATRALGGLLVGVRPADPGVFAVVIGGLAVVTAAAALLPARRAARLDPLSALRSDG